ncbi:hypothetical protein N7489_008564 [Penicillium chrysogenum]|jgi:hypothetical protein|uniref:C2H2-type domain-containing protein n=1 Tax=Penicillium chrysogenum TaxID=5076 RepID=A0ABQ8X0U3_PENCH|nr:uncharacterized protein N7489_008564 [Penicillium chrysogenum]KAJ5227856.1 hypothetical protein N7489_008564 [Penicillium chrysogenum]KAJ5284511.1 hypothetical protein N7505_002491 [Penicillium chrysogenum]KAJ5286419.1 hypothetical protein N7524_001725 [Penicillium chrysogenum]KAJ6167359.1 hypothetical protein N7497_000202 [Penicillium chrysogenum]
MSDNELPSSFLNDIDLDCSLFPDLPDLTNDDGLSPLDRWKNSPPETEAVDLSDIVNSIRLDNSQGRYHMRQDSQYADFSQRGHRRSRRSPSLVAASDSTRSSASSSSASSAHSFGSNVSGSFGRFYAGVPTRRRRRRQRKKSPVSRGRTQSPKRLYQCTFCTDTFKSKHDWVRHEKSLHLSLESWTCAPFGPTYKIEGATPSRCVYCNIEDPSETHVRDHRFWECQQKPSVLRTFYRKDHLIQHLRLVHGTDNSIPHVEETWRSEVTNVNSRCGFCKQTFTRWADRNNHLAAHFREGLLMKEWKGCRGLDPAVALAVENAMPPYLIGAECTGINPFSASTRCPNPQNVNNESYPQQKANIQPTPFEQLTERLIRFVRERQSIGVPVTDDAIQHEARCFVYGDEDPWNQTAADNADWLRLFKDGMGLGPSLSTTTTDSDAVSQKQSFPLPWPTNTTNTPGSNEPQSPPESCSRVAPPVDAWMPWAWQSPECLAEFRRSNDPSGSCPMSPQK